METIEKLPHQVFKESEQGDQDKAILSINDNTNSQCQDSNLGSQGKEKQWPSKKIEVRSRESRGKRHRKNQNAVSKHQLKLVSTDEASKTNLNDTQSGKLEKPTIYVRRSQPSMKLSCPLPQGTVSSFRLLRTKKLFSIVLDFMLLENFEPATCFHLRKDGKLCFESSRSIFEGESHLVGVLVSNFRGSRYNLFRHNSMDSLNNLTPTILTATIIYSDDKPYRNCEFYFLNGVNVSETWSKLYLPQKYDSLKDIMNHDIRNSQHIGLLRSKEPVLNDNTNCYGLNLGRNCLSSTKNCVMIDSAGTKVLRLCKTGTDEFQLSVRNPMSALLAYCFAISSLEFKWMTQ